MTSHKFYEQFVEYAFQLSGDYESRIQNLEYEVEKLKALIKSMYILIDRDLDSYQGLAK
jgi:hypothetical protein